MKKKLLLAMAVLGAAAWQGANAIVLKANDNEFANVGLNLQIWAQNDGKVTSTQQNSNNFIVNDALIYFSGQINPIVQFGADFEFPVSPSPVPYHEGITYARVSDAFINFKFMPEFQLMAGLFRDPVSRLTGTDSYTYVIPTGYGYGFDTVWGNIPIYTKTNTSTNQSTTVNLSDILNPFETITIGDIDGMNPPRDAGIAIWGNVADTMLKYYLFAANGAYDYSAGYNTNSNLKYGIRVAFTPTMLGYKNSSGFGDQDTFLGALNNLTIDLGYEQQKLDCSGVNANNTALYYMCDQGNTSSLTPKYYNVDAIWEQKFGTFVPQIQLGWAEKQDLMATKYGNVKSTGYYVQIAALYDQMVGIGKPGIAFRWDYSKVDNYAYTTVTTNGSGTSNTTITSIPSAKINRYGIFLNYYIAGEAARISLGADIVEPDSNLKNVSLPNGGGYLKNFTDWTLALQTEF